MGRMLKKVYFGESFYSDIFLDLFSYIFLGFTFLYLKDNRWILSFSLDIRSKTNGDAFISVKCKLNTDRRFQFFMMITTTLRNCSKR